MKKIKRYLILYKYLFIQGLKSRMSYRADFLISMVSIILSNIMGYAIFWIIFRNFDSIGGYSYYQMIFIYGFYLMAISPESIFFSNSWNLGEKVYSGDFIIFSTKPINIFFYYYSEKFDFNALAQFVLGIIVFVYAWIKLKIKVTVFRIIFFTVELCFSSLILISIMVSISALSFYIVNSDNILDLMNKLKEYARYPATIYNVIFTFVFSFIIPLCYISYYPCKVLLDNKFTSVYTYLSPVVGVLMFYISYKIWIHSAKSYIGTGS